MAPSLRRARTGNTAFDDALGGGIPWGNLALVESEAGAGGAEFAFTLLREALRQRQPSRARVATALRAPRRVRWELEQIFPDEAWLEAVDVRALRPEHAEADLAAVAEALGEGDLVVVEGFAALAPPEGARTVALLRGLADRAAEAGFCVLLLHAPHALPAAVAAALPEMADVVVRFEWRDAGATRRRHAILVKMRGLGGAWERDQVPILEVVVQKGVGIAASKVRSLV